MSDTAALMSDTLVLLSKAREFVKESESLFGNCFPVPALNEFRNVAYHLAEHVADPSNGDAIVRAHHHAQTAYLDAGEAYALALLESVKACERDYYGYSHIVMETLPRYREQRAAVARLRRGFSSAPGDSSPDRIARAADMEATFADVRAFLEDLTVYGRPIQDRIRKEKNLTLKWAAGFLISAVSSVVTFVLTRLVGGILP